MESLTSFGDRTANQERRSLEVPKNCGGQLATHDRRRDFLEHCKAASDDPPRFPSVTRAPHRASRAHSGDTTAEPLDDAVRHVTRVRYTLASPLASRPAAVWAPGGVAQEDGNDIKKVVRLATTSSRRARDGDGSSAGDGECPMLPACGGRHHSAAHCLACCRSHQDSKKVWGPGGVAQEDQG